MKWHSPALCLRFTDQPPALLLGNRENWVFPSSVCHLLFRKPASHLPSLTVGVPVPQAPRSPLQPCRALPAASCPSPRYLPCVARPVSAASRLLRLLLHLQQGAWTKVFPGQPQPPLGRVQNPSQVYKTCKFYAAKCISSRLSASIPFVTVQYLQDPLKLLAVSRAHESPEEKFALAPISCLCSSIQTINNTLAQQEA